MRGLAADHHRHENHAGAGVVAAVLPLLLLLLSLLLLSLFLLSLFLLSLFLPSLFLPLFLSFLLCHCSPQLSTPRTRTEAGHQP
jgi:hypothetical protein